MARRPRIVFRSYDASMIERVRKNQVNRGFRPSPPEMFAGFKYKVYRSDHFFHRVPGMDCNITTFKDLCHVLEDMMESHPVEEENEAVEAEEQEEHKEPDLLAMYEQLEKDMRVKQAKFLQVKKNLSNLKTAIETVDITKANLVALMESLL